MDSRESAQQAKFVKPIPITRVQVQQQCCDQRGHDVDVALVIVNLIPHERTRCIESAVKLNINDDLSPSQSLSEWVQNDIKYM
eukprot:scaffold6143_cov147-Skeletonema_dohrnii-CCMP3373.AAC.16